MEGNDAPSRASRPHRKRPRIPVPSFRPMETGRRKPPEQGPKKQKPPAPAPNTAPTQQQKVLPAPKPRSSRIGGVLSYQRYLQHVDPSRPQHYTRKELRVMNDETPDNQESSPSPARTTTASSTTKETPPVLPSATAATATTGATAAAVVASPLATQPATVLTVAWTPPATDSGDSSTPSGQPNKMAGNQTSAAAAATTVSTVGPRPTKIVPRTGQDTTPSGKKETTTDASQTSKKRSTAATAVTTTSTNNNNNNNNNNTPSSPSSNETPPTFRLYFVPRGRDMHQGVLEGPKRIARTRGAIVLETFDKDAPKADLPTHLVVGTVASPDVVSRALDFESPLALQHFLFENKMQCVTKAWVVFMGTKKPTEPYQNPRPGFVLQQLGLRHLEIYAPLVPRAPPTSSLSVPKGHAHGTTTAAMRSQPRNVSLARVFKQLSKEYAAAPTEKNDVWRSYTFENASSRLQALDFEIDSAESLKRAEKIKGFGSSTIEVMREFVIAQNDKDDDERDEDGSFNKSSSESCVTRLKNIRNDPNRQALRAMMKIWGVGVAKGLELARAGYRTVEQVRRDFEANRLNVTLHRNQYVGLLCYDDILEEMERSEVERITDIVRHAVQEFYSQAEVEIMGSYRRGSQSCGDVDILLTHPKFIHKVPPRVLGKIIDSLRVSGHIAFNLTQLAGMDTDAWETLPSSIAKRFGHSKGLHAKADKDGCSSYMGIINSPVHPGKKRRIDIKFYPYRERIWAKLYFTGNGFFNRSMRLWARKFGYSLSDHGLFQRGSDVRVMDAMNEEQIFRRLELVYRGPTERDGFDAVIGLDSKRAVDLEALSTAEFFREESHHAWIK